jgi:hypothetical protein
MVNILINLKFLLLFWFIQLETRIRLSIEGEEPIESEAVGILHSYGTVN